MKPDFIPNNDISSLRKKRIEKAQEYGAIWAKEWSAEVTHVIADQHLTLLDVKKAIGEDQLKAKPSSTSAFLATSKSC